MCHYQNHCSFGPRIVIWGINFQDTFRWKFSRTQFGPFETKILQIHVRFSKIQNLIPQASLLSKDELLIFSELGEILILVDRGKIKLFLPRSRLAETAFFKTGFVSTFLNGLTL